MNLYFFQISKQQLLKVKENIDALIEECILLENGLKFASKINLSNLLSEVPQTK
jgi:hypothetical protein